MTNKDFVLPLVSVIVPTFNRSQLLMRAIDSVLKQSYRNIELIIVDDGSTDDTQTIVNGISQRAHQVTYFKKMNGGCASARNMGLGRANGELVAFLDSDDMWEPDAVETLVYKLLDSDSDLVYSPSIEVSPKGHGETNYPVAAGRAEMLAKEHFMKTNVRNGAYLFRRAVYERVGGLNESLRYNEDSDFFQRLAIHCKAAYSPKPTVRVYSHSGSKSRNRKEIYRALLYSSQQILAKNPDFAAALGTDADKRIVEIKGQLIEALTLVGEFDEAINLAKDILPSLRPSLRFAIRSKKNFLLKLENLSRKFINRFLKKSFQK